jgi:threonine dehydrogenase-like Zn-dependent dehydrogenase
LKSENKLQGAFLEKVHELKIKDVSLPKINDNEVLVKVKNTGICGTDIHIYNGEIKIETPIILGHEFSGVVEKIGKNVKNYFIGDKVAVEPNIVCGKCYACRMSDRNFYCKELKAIGIHRNGAFAQYVKSREENLYSIPVELSFEEAALLEPLACCVRGINRMSIKTGDIVAVFGAGPIGLMLSQLAIVSGATSVIQTDIDKDKLKLAKKLGVNHVIDASEEDPLEQIMKITDGYGVAKSIEAVGRKETLNQALQVLCKGGNLHIFGVSPQNLIWKIKPFELYSKELTITTSNSGPFTFQQAISIASTKKVKLKPLISHIFKLEEIKTVFEKIENKEDKMVKVLIKPN